MILPPLLLLLAALALPIVSWLTQWGAFGTPGIGEMASRFPTLIGAAGYAFSIWGLIFVLVVALGIWQFLPANRTHPLLRIVRIPASVALMMCAIWMPVFTAGAFHLAAALLVAAAILLLYCLLQLQAARHGSRAEQLLLWVQGSVSAAWVTLAAALNLAQLRAATGFLADLPLQAFSLGLLLAAGVVLAIVNHRQRGNPVMVATAVWALLAIFVQQSAAGTREAAITACSALALAALLLLQLVWLVRARRIRPAPGAPTAGLPA